MPFVDASSGLFALVLRQSFTQPKLLTKIHDVAENDLERLWLLLPQEVQASYATPGRCLCLKKKKSPQGFTKHLTINHGFITRAERKTGEKEGKGKEKGQPFVTRLATGSHVGKKNISFSYVKREDLYRTKWLLRQAKQRALRGRTSDTTGHTMNGYLFFCLFQDDLSV